VSNVITLRTAQWLGHLGLLPFLFLAIASWLPLAPQEATRVTQALVAYAAVILSFIGAVYWGFVLSMAAPARELVRAALIWSVTPALLGWLVLLLMIWNVPARVLLVLLIADFILLRLIDGGLVQRLPHAPGWYLRLRTRLTLVVVAALAAALAAQL
jgi:Protein of unknown function (DUF3429)